MKMLLLACITPILIGFFTSSCTSNTSGYASVSYGGSPYWYDSYGRYYRRYWYGYRPCPKPPGKPDRPPKPVHPIAPPPGNKPSNPVTLPSTTRPTNPSMRPTTRPSTRPSTMSRPAPAMRGGGGRGSR